jgi:hypothetical protein
LLVGDVIFSLEQQWFGIAYLLGYYCYVTWSLANVAVATIFKAVPLHAMEALGGRGGIAPSQWQLGTSCFSVRGSVVGNT